METLINIGPLTVRWYGVIFALAVLAAYITISRLAKISKLNRSQLENSLFFVLIFGLIGARAYHVADQWSYYSQHLIQILEIYNGGIGIYGGLIGGLTGLVLYAKIHKAKIFPILDVITPGLILAQGIGRWGNYFNQEAYGAPTSLPWAITIDPLNRLTGFENYSTYHPTFFYESVLCLVFFALLIFIFRKSYKKIGTTFGFYLIFYGLTRLIVEQFRIDTWQEGGVKIAQIISALFLIAGVLTVFLIRKKRQKPKLSY